MGGRWGGARGPRSTSYPRRPHATHRATTRDRPYRSTPEPRCPSRGIRRIPHTPCHLAVERQNVLFAKCRGLSWAPVEGDNGAAHTSASRSTPGVGLRRIPHTRAPFGSRTDNSAALKIKGHVSCGRPLFAISVGASLVGARWGGARGPRSTSYPRRPRWSGQGAVDHVLRHIRAASTPPIGRPHTPWDRP